MDNNLQQISGTEDSQDDFLVLKFVLFNEKEHAVQAEVVAKMLDAMILLANEAVVQQGHSDTPLVKVEAIQKGSLEILLSITQAVISIIPTFITTANDIWQFIKNWLEFRLTMNNPSQKLEKLEDVTQTGKAESSTIINCNYFINNGDISINNGIKEGFSAAEKDPGLKSIRFCKQSSPQDCVEVPREDFHIFTKDISCDTKIREKIIETELKLRTVNFDGGKWKAICQSENISVMIQDQEFLNQVNNGLISFQSTTTLDVTMKIVQKYDPNMDEYITDKTQYTVIKVKTPHPKKNSKNIAQYQNKDQMKISFEE
ncbi:MAG: hypothetical protein Q4A17_01620 [Thermoguttaceae bacterium]|nr:hypothetical protein [Thermoguttaceae bacterium]